MWAAGWEPGMWTGVAAATAAALGPLCVWVGRQWEARRQRTDALRDAHVTYLQDEVAELRQDAAQFQRDRRHVRDYVVQQVDTLGRLRDLYGACRARGEAVYGTYALACERLKQANAGLLSANLPAQEVPPPPAGLAEAARQEAEEVAALTAAAREARERLRRETTPAKGGDDV